MVRRALTLLEVLIVISIVGLLMALLLPAMQRAREAGRRSQCASNLRQIGVALHAYQSTYLTFPCGLAATMTGSIGHAYSHHSPQCRLLPYLGNNAIYNLCNFEFPHDGHPFDGWSINTTAYASQIECFMCPSDPSRLGTRPGGNNYRFSFGPSAWEQPEPLGGMFAAFVWYSERDVSDGLSNTVACSERARGDADRSRFGKGDYWYGGYGGFSPSPDIALQFCNAIPVTGSAHESTGGITWFHAGFHCTWFNHVAPPNSKTDCAQAFPRDSHNLRRGVFSAQSYHVGGVNVLFGDGRTRFVTDTIDLNLWRALGSRQGGETLSSPF